MARDIPWLREECGIILVEAAMGLGGRVAYQECAKAIIEKLAAFKLVYTPEGVATWLTVQLSYDSVLPDSIWHSKDPLSKRERIRLAKALRENYHEGPHNAKDETVKSGGSSPNPSFAWTLVLKEALRRDTISRQKQGDASRSEFAQFWIDIVDSTEQDQSCCIR